MLAFRSENEKTAKKFEASNPSTHASTAPANATDTPISPMLTDPMTGINKITAPQTMLTLQDHQAVSSFFERFVGCPCNDRSTPGFLDCLPALFKEVNMEGRSALRWAVLAAGYAGLPKDQENRRTSHLALYCYGHALSVLGNILADPEFDPDDHVLMTVVILDLFEVNMPDARSCVRYVM